MIDKNLNDNSTAETSLYKECLLNCLELCTIIFRGIQENECAEIIENGLPALATLSTKSLQSLSGPLRDLEETCPAATNEFYDELEAEYVRIFISNRDGIIAPLYESCYAPGSTQVMGEASLTMRKRLNAAELSPSGSLASEPPDHLCIELEYLYILLIKGWGRGDEDALLTARAFAGETLIWVRSLRDKLSSGGAIKFYVAAANLLISILEEITSD